MIAAGDSRTSPPPVVVVVVVVDDDDIGRAEKLFPLLRATSIEEVVCFCC